MAATDAQITELLGTTRRPLTRGWLLAFAVCGALTLLLLAMMGLTFARGIGVWGNQMPVAWGFGIVNFVWWIGIGHAGTFISAILLVAEARGIRTSINRFSEGMTLFAVMMAGLFPILHLGRPWFAYWLVPYPSVMGTWPQLQSALPWDAAAIATYLTISVVFWYLGLIPDLAALRDRTAMHQRRRRIVYGIFALGWRGSSQQWRVHKIAYLLLAAIATPLVVSVHSIVSLDFASTGLPGWHSTIFPPFFVAGAIFSGFAVVVVLLVPARKVFGLEKVITERHFDAIGKLLLAMSWIALYSYVAEMFGAYYSGDPYDIHQQLIDRPFGAYAITFWIMIACNCIVPQLLWSRRARTSTRALFVVGVLVAIGMWLERFEIVVVSLAKDFLPSAWRLFAPTWVDLGLLAGTLGCFGFLFLVFLRWIPFVPVAELKQLRDEEPEAVRC